MGLPISHTNVYQDLMITPIVSPCGQPLELFGFAGREGLSQWTDCDIFEVVMTWQQLADQFECEANSDQIPEYLKHQRDVSVKDARVKGMISYLDRNETLFPSLIIFVNRVSSLQTPMDAIKRLCLQPQAERLICDGQGRTTCIKAVLPNQPEFADRTVAVKLIVTNSDSLYDEKTSTLIKQVFSDVNGQTKKPDTSLSMYFDMSRPLSRMMKEVLEETLLVEGNPVVMRDLIALNGKIKDGQIYTLKQYTDAVPVLFNQSAKTLNDMLKNEQSYAMTKEITVRFFREAFAQLPLANIVSLKGAEFKKLYKDAMFTKALFLKGLAYLGCSMFDEQLSEGREVNWKALTVLPSLPLDTLDAPLWLDHKVCWADDEKGTAVAKIYKQSDRKIARILCQKCRVFPTMDI